MALGYAEDIPLTPARSCRTTERVPCMSPARPEIVLHINLADLSTWRTRERLGLFRQIADLCDAHDLPFSVVHRAASLTKACVAQPDGRLHIVEDGRVCGEGWLNAALAYLLGFWHLDPHGILALSAARTHRFNPREVPDALSAAFFTTLRQRFVKPRHSRYHQPRDRDKTLPEGAIAVFLQGKKPFADGQCSLAMHEMILAVTRGAGGRPVVVKPHPLSVTDCAYAIARAADQGAVFDVFDGNIHDLLATCAVTVSANSAAAMEGFLHRKPAILFGDSDFESLVTRVHRPEDFATALDSALAAKWRFRKMLFWYFSRHTLDLTAPDFHDRLFATFDRAGFSRKRLGL